ncbi:MAG: hypothetical protein O6952_08070 [Planctomycetota bacterium]|nr:hypothetical protein [Planctomycetota bacterium]
MIDRVSELERRQRVLFLILIAVGSGAFLLGVGAKPTDSETVEVKRLVVLNDKGVPVIELSADAGGGLLVLRAAAGKDQVLLRTDELGGIVRTFQADGRRATANYTYRVSATRTAGMLENYDFESRAAVSIGSGDSSPAPASMGAGCDGGVVVLNFKGEPVRLEPSLLKKVTALLKSGKK